MRTMGVLTFVVVSVLGTFAGGAGAQVPDDAIPPAPPAPGPVLVSGAGGDFVAVPVAVPAGSSVGQATGPIAATVDDVEFVAPAIDGAELVVGSPMAASAETWPAWRVLALGLLGTAAVAMVVVRTRAA